MGKVNTNKSGRIYAACIGREIRTDKVAECLQGTNWTQVQHMSDENSDGSVLFQQDLPGADLGGRLHAFVFDFGCIVCWNCSKNVELFSYFSFSCHCKPAKPGDEYHEDDLTFVLGAPRLVFAMIGFTSTSYRNVCYFVAFAQSVKLSVYECEVDNVVQQSRSYPETLAMTGNSVTRPPYEEGQLFLRAIRFFRFGMLDTPEYFWESDEYELIYAKARTYLEMDKRMWLLTQRLDIVRELLDKLSQASRIHMLIALNGS